MRKITISRYIDSSHSWGKVKLSVLEKLGIADKITPYSYQRNEDAYLEEDVDLPLLLATLEEKGVKVRVFDFPTEKSSKIRSYQRYGAAAIVAEVTGNDTVSAVVDSLVITPGVAGTWPFPVSAGEPETVAEPVTTVTPVSVAEAVQEAVEAVPEASVTTEQVAETV